MQHEILRYLYRLQARDLSLTHSMIPLGSCTMKLNATAEMLSGELQLDRLAASVRSGGTKPRISGGVPSIGSPVSEITGFAAVSLQPNAGSQGEHGLMVIRAYHRSQGEFHRDVCLIPVSAHGTNPASAAMVGMTVAGGM